MSFPRAIRTGAVRAAHVLALAATALGAAGVAAQAPERLRGFVDGSAFVDLAGDDSASVEVSLRGALLRALTHVDPELAELTRGLESIQAVILDFDDSARAVRALELVRKTEKDLRGRGWQPLVRVRQRDGDLHVLVLGDEEHIQGLVVLGSDRDDKVVFANIAGTLDLAAIARIGEEWELPGLDQLGDRDDED